MKCTRQKGSGLWPPLLFGGHHREAHSLIAHQRWTGVHQGWSECLSAHSEDCLSDIETILIVESSNGARFNTMGAGASVWQGCTGSLLAQEMGQHRASGGFGGRHSKGY